MTFRKNHRCRDFRIRHHTGRRSGADDDDAGGNGGKAEET